MLIPKLQISYNGDRLLGDDHLSKLMIATILSTLSATDPQGCDNSGKKCCRIFNNDCDWQ